MKLYYSPDYVGAAYGFDTTRKAGWIVDSLTDHPIDGVELHTPTPLQRIDLERVHDGEYIDAVRTGDPLELAESQGFDWDPALWPMVCSSNGGVLDAARSALDDGVAGSLSSGLHHAKRDRGDGFCTFNGLVVAAKALLAEGRIGSVLILDLDAHCGAAQRNSSRTTSASGRRTSPSTGSTATPDAPTRCCRTSTTPATTFPPSSRHSRAAGTNRSTARCPGGCWCWC